MSSTNTGGSVSADFWTALRAILAEQGWRVNHFAAYPVMAVKRDWVVGMIDAHAQNPDAAFHNLNKWAQEQNIAPSRLLVAVYLQTTEQAWKTVTNLQEGNRMGPQAMAAVFQLIGGQFYPPKAPEWSLLSGYSGQISYDSQVDQEVQAALHKTLSPR